MTNHIIHSSDGDIYDLTTNRYPFGLLPKDVQKAMIKWPHGLEIWIWGGKWSDTNPEWGFGSVYRAKHAPRVTERVFYVDNEGAEIYGGPRNQPHDTHRFTIRYPGDTLPAGEYKGPDGAAFVVEDLR